MKKILLITLLILSLSTSITAQNAPSAHPAVVTPTDDARSTVQLRQETFDVVWRTVKDKHFDPTLGGVDWYKVREKYEPRLSSINDNNALYGLLQEMLGELHQSHFNIIPPEAIVADDVKEPPNGGVGLDVRMLDGKAVVTRVDAESTAAQNGIRTGFVIKKVEDTTVEDLYERARKRKEPTAWVNLRTARAVPARLNGKPQEKLRFTYLDERNKEHEVTLERERLKGEMSKPLGNFPPQYTELESKRIAGNIGYIRFNTFALNLTERIKDAVRSMNSADGVIFDLRGNPGGVGGMATTIASVLSNQSASLGTMRMRTGEVRFVVFPQRDPNLKPVVILIDGSSASTSEIFAGGMQEIGRAMIVGERSLGAALPSSFQKLPTGALFQFAIADFKTPRGVLLEGRGVLPNVEVKLTRSTLLQGRDLQLEAAVEQIQRRSKAVANSR